MNRTAIQWTDYTLQLVRFRSKATGRAMNWCEKVSPGCRACYAERITRRFHGAQHSYTPAGRDLVEPYLDRDALRELVTTRRRGMVLVEDMSDLFGDWVPDEWLDACFAAFALSPLTIQILTKRAKRQQAYIADPETQNRIAGAAVAMAYSGAALAAAVRVVRWGGAEKGGYLPAGLTRWPLPNVWLGVSVEDQPRAIERIPHLLRTPAAVRFLSLEPLLEHVSLEPAIVYARPRVELHSAIGKLHLAIIGGESGPRARPFNIAWVRSLLGECRDLGVAPFLKQLGSNPIYSHDVTRDGTEFTSGWPAHVTFPRGCTVKLRDSRHGGDMDEWAPDLRVREMPQVNP